MALFLIGFTCLWVRQYKIYSKINSSEQKKEMKVRPLVHEIKTVTRNELRRNLEHMGIYHNGVSYGPPPSENLPGSKSYQEEYLDNIKKIEETKENDLSSILIKKQLDESCKNSISKDLMIPLCVPFEDKNLAKQFGAKWCPVIKSWFYPFDGNLNVVDKWLPQLYRAEASSPLIRVRLVPQPLWGINPRSLLPKETWDSLRQLTYSQTGNRCYICGCRGEKWPVECDEMWSYSLVSSTSANARFEGLQALCPSCHQIHHFGKARVEGKEEIAFARLRYFNNWTIDQATNHIDKAFLEWDILSEINDWYINTDVLEKNYGVELPESDFMKKVG